MINLKKLAQNPIVLIGSIFLGIITGIYFPAINFVLQPINTIYTSLLQVCSLPIIIAILTISIGKLLSGKFCSVLIKWIVFSLIIAIFSSIVGICTSIGMTNFLTPDNKGKIALQKASDYINNREISDSFSELKIYQTNDISNDDKFYIIDFLVDVVPKNIFTALSDNRILQVLLCFIIFGSMLNFVEKKFSKPIEDLLLCISEVLSKFTSLLLLFLPVSIFMAMASLFSNVNNLIVLKSVIAFIVVNYLAMIILIILFSAIIICCTKVSIKAHLSAMKRTFFLSIGTCKSSVVLPVTIKDSIEKNNMNKKVLNSLLPLGTLFSPNGNIVSATILGVYTLMIYDRPKTFRIFFAIVLGSIIFAIAKSSGVAVAVILPTMLQPLSVSSDVMIVILLAVMQFYAGISTFLDIYSNLTVTALVSVKRKR